jgi:hypothetical protein
MAGGFGSKQNPKNNLFNKSGFNNNEILKSSDSYTNEKPQHFGLNGILRLGQPVEINKAKSVEHNWKKEFLSSNNLGKEQQTLIRQQQAELQRSIDELRTEIKKLVISAEGLETEVEQVAFQPVVEANDYQLNVLQRIKRLIANFTLNISQAGIWCESFSRKKNKRNAFWSTVRNKKIGGEQYLFSSEHSAARSTN